MNPKKFILIMPVLNEAKNLPTIFRQFNKLTPHPDEFIFADNSSTDYSYTMLLAYARVIPHVHVARELERGYLPPQIKAFQMALDIADADPESDYYFIKCDCDGSFPPDYIRRFQKAVTQRDIVIIDDVDYAYDKNLTPSEIALLDRDAAALAPYRPQLLATSYLVSAAVYSRTPITENGAGDDCLKLYDYSFYPGLKIKTIKTDRVARINKLAFADYEETENLTPEERMANEEKDIEVYVRFLEKLIWEQKSPIVQKIRQSHPKITYNNIWDIYKKYGKHLLV
jgi:glycosyltransferase involved in cell wall biosynthesis